MRDKRNFKGFVEVSLYDGLIVEYKEIKIRPIVLKEIDCQDYENSLLRVDASDVKDALVEVKLTNLTPLQSVDIQNSDIRKLFSSAMSVSVKREFTHICQNKKSYEVEAVSLEEFFLEHLAKDSQAEEFERLRGKVQELFAAYEEALDDNL